MSETDTVYLLLSNPSHWQKIEKFSIPNRAMNFGDGLFETMIFEGLKLNFLTFI